MSIASFRATLPLVLGCVGVLITGSSFTPPASATIYGELNGSERTWLNRYFHEAHQSIHIRCSRLSDLVLVQSLVDASRRGIQVQIITDTLSPGLVRAANAKLPHFAIRLTSKSYKGEAFSRDRSYALVDRTIVWYGVKKWSPQYWKGRSEMILDSRHPDNFPETGAFPKLWQQSEPVLPKHIL